MTSQLITLATRVTTFLRPSVTTLQEIYSARNTTRSVFDHITMMCTINASYSVAINDGTTDWLIADTIPLTANSSPTILTLGEPVLQRTWSIKVRSSVANAILFELTMQEINRMSTK